MNMNPQQDLFWTNDPLVAIQSAMKRGDIIPGLIYKVDKKEIPVSGGGTQVREYVTMDLGGIEGVCSDAEFDAHSYRTLRGFIGHTVYVVVLDIIKDEETGKSTAIVSRRKAEEKRAAKLLESLKEGDIVNGVISGWNENNDTIFINIGGVDAFCYLVDWDHIRTPSVRDAGVKGQPVTVVVTKINQDPFFIRVSRKEASKDPWSGVEQEFPPGTDLLGIVANVDPKYGIFVRVKRGVTLLATLPQRSRLPKPVAGMPVRGVIKWISEQQRRGKMIITSYPHGAPKQGVNPGAYLFE